MGQINLNSYLKRIAYKKANLYVTTHNAYSKITSEMLIQYASENSGIPEAQMAAAFLALKKEVSHYILNGHTLELMDLGTLYLSVTAKAVEDEEDAGAKAVKRVSIKFRQSKKLRDLINSNVQLVTALTKKQDDNSDGEDGGNTSSTETDGGSTSGGNSGTGNSTSGISQNGSSTNSGSNSGSDSNIGGSTGGNSSSQSGTEGDYQLVIYKYGSGTSTVTDDSEQVINSGDNVHSGTNVIISVVPAEGKEPIAKVNDNRITLTENGGTYTGSFQMPTKGTILEINSEPDEWDYGN